MFVLDNILMPSYYIEPPPRCLSNLHAQRFPFFSGGKALGSGLNSISVRNHCPILLLMRRKFICLLSHVQYEHLSHIIQRISRKTLNFQGLIAIANYLQIKGS